MSTIEPPFSDSLNQPEQPEQTSGDKMLEDLAAITGLFSSAQLVEELHQLEALDAAEHDEQPAPKAEPDDTPKPYGT
jgi:hypothetical protein